MPTMLRYYEIVESEHRILNPITEEKLALLGEICRLRPDQRMLDLCCGKAELLATWSARYGLGGVGVDISPVFLTAARARLAELGVADRIELVEADAGTYAPAERFDLVGCVGATWIGGGLAGTLPLLRAAVKPGGLILVGEPYWITPLPDEVVTAAGFGPDEFVSLPGTLDRFEAGGLELIEMVLASPDSWDRYEARHWANANAWLRANPDDPDADWLRDRVRTAQRAYVTCRRPYLGWGVFVLQA